MVERYAAGEGGGEAAEGAGADGRAFVSVNWVLSEAPLDLETELAWGFLDYLLLGTSAHPLHPHGTQHVDRALLAHQVCSSTTPAH